MSTGLEDHDSPPRPARRRTWVVLVLAAFVVGLLIGGSDAEEPRSRPPEAVAEVRRDERSAARLVAERRYADGVRAGLARGRAAVRRGSAGYKRIWRRGYREAERTLRARAAAASPAAGGTYASGHRDGYNEGYDEGYGHADAGRPYDNSDNDTPGSAGDDDAGALDGARSTAGESSDGGADCHPSYEGACVPSDAGDVNCPEVPGTDVRVVGEDVYGLDREGDGVACES